MRMSVLISAWVFGLFAMPSLPAAEHTKDTTEAIKDSLSKGKAVLLDVREKSEWDDGHLKDAKLLPWSELKAGAKADDIAKVIPKDTIVYCHCASGVRCLKAADALQKLGYDVRPLKAGYENLVKSGFKVAEK